MNDKLTNSFHSLKFYCEAKNFAGWDPYDGLNSKIFKATPLKYWYFARLAWIQGFKRSPINFRKLLMVSKQHNAKGIGLFLSGYCNLYEFAEKGNNEFGSKIEIVKKINTLSKLLVQLQSNDYSGACWGYNFDWQARGALFFPKGTPTIVATSFAANGLMDAYEVTKNEEYLKVAISTADFVLNDLSRSYREDGSFIFSYSPLFGNNTVYNASLLGSKLLARIYSYTGNQKTLDPAVKSVQAVLNAQQADGSWVYGELKIQNWKDSYHTGFNLVSLAEYRKYSGDDTVMPALEKGFEFYINNFFLQDGTPKYYHDKTYPIDIHSPAQFMITLSKLNKFSAYDKLAERVLNWTIDNMQHPSKGYFYYQLKKGFSSKISYMRWSQAWMMHALTFYLLEKSK